MAQRPAVGGCLFFSQQATYGVARFLPLPNEPEQLFSLLFTLPRKPSLEIPPRNKYIFRTPVRYHPVPVFNEPREVVTVAIWVSAIAVFTHSLPFLPPSFLPSISYTTYE